MSALNQQAALDNAKHLVSSGKLSDAIKVYEEVVYQSGSSEEINKIREEAILKLAGVYRLQKDAVAIQKLVAKLRPYFDSIPKARTGKLVRGLIDEASKVPGSGETVIELCKESIEWSENEGRSFLRQSLQTKLAEAYFEVGKYQDAIKIISPLLKEIKKLDDKRVLVDIHLLESRIQHQLRHLPKSRASLTSARTAANAIYCPPKLQAELDLQTGTLHAEEKDYKTAYSYFYEGYENYQANSGEEAARKAKLCLKYMLLTKIMSEAGSDDLQNLTQGKLAEQFAHLDLTAMMEIAKSYSNSSLLKYKEAIDKHKDELERDPVIHRHLKDMYQKMFERNLLRIVLPFSQVEIDHVAKLIELDVPTVEKKLSQMILDKKLLGILDQGNGCLILFEEQEEDQTYKSTLETVKNIGTVVDSLHTRARKLK
eukprot:TRINITY_DN3327_c0_g1_i1.p2 TRINITY_DN3327_c0_g1~~TRINITY_DN3327_c0_g1_i1.p2  ORF type:complete len:427 (-),score=119.77 TRINITY_DN3327_c0_g1_i1:23-1303(-)